jgi:hypothetical protein
MLHTIPLRAQRALPPMVVLNFAVFPLSNAQYSGIRLSG